jgi:hypothetical protein
MPITKDGSGRLIETPVTDKDQFDRTGVMRDDQFAVCDNVDRTKQMRLEAGGQAPDSSVTLSAGANSGNITLTLPTTSGTLALSGGGGSNSFATIQPDLGTSPVASSSSDTLTLTSSDSSITITGNSSTDTVDLKVASVPDAANVTYTPTTSGDWPSIPTKVKGALDTLAPLTFRKPTTSSTYVNSTPSGSLSGIQNTAVGSGAGGGNTSASGNTLIGYNAGTSLTQGGSNVVVGYAAANVGTLSSGLVVIGSQATNGSGTTNVAIGANAGTATGAGTGSSNVLLGSYAGAQITNGSQNVAVGHHAGLTTTTGSNNIFLGAESGLSVANNTSNQCVIGAENYPITGMWVGEGRFSASPGTILISGTGGSGSNISGSTVQIAGGPNTGSGTPGNIELQTGVTGGSSSTLSSLTTRLTVAPTAVTSDVDLKLNTAGNGFYIKEGSNCTMGSATLVGGAATVSTTKVTANSRIFLTHQSDGGTPGWVRVSARSAGTSFTVTSSSGTDTSVVAWLLVEPA